MTPLLYRASIELIAGALGNIVYRYFIPHVFPNFWLLLLWNNFEAVFGQTISQMDSSPKNENDVFTYCISKHVHAPWYSPKWC